MTRNSENGRTFYGDTLMRLGIDDTSYLDHFLDLRRISQSRIKEMRKLTNTSRPASPYITYRAPTLLDERSSKYKYMFHGAKQITLVEAILDVNDVQEGSFAIDSRRQIVLADSQSLIPRADQYNMEVKTNNLIRLSPDDPSIKLTKLSIEFISQILLKGCSLEFIMLLLAEAVDEDVNTILPAIERKLRADDQ